LATLHFVGWVEPNPGFVGFRCTQPNLHFAGVIANCETQQRPILEPSFKSFYFDHTGRIFFAGGWADPPAAEHLYFASLNKQRSYCPAGPLFPSALSEKA